MGKHFTRPRVKVFLLKEFSERVSVRLTAWGREEKGDEGGDLGSVSNVTINKNLCENQSLMLRY